jgi:putative protease
MLSHLQDLEKAGVCSFKIEGRMKSGYYLATVINAYRRLLDGGEFALSDRELSNVAHREYTQAYAFGENKDTVNYEDSQSRGDYVYIADVKGAENGYAYLEMRNRFKRGDVLEVLSPDGNFAKTFVADEIYDSKGTLSEDCKLVQEIYKVKCPYVLQEGDYIRRKANK